MRQLPIAPIAVPSGTPSAVAAERPPTTIASARPRHCCGVTPTVTVIALGMKRAAPTAASTRAAKSTA